MDYQGIPTVPGCEISLFADIQQIGLADPNLVACDNCHGVSRPSFVVRSKDRGIPLFLGLTCMQAEAKRVSDGRPWMVQS